jgi:hypothetical protein
VKKKPLLRLITTGLFVALLSGTVLEAVDTEARLTKACDALFDSSTTKEKLVQSLIELLDITLSLTASSEHKDEIKHHVDVAKDLFKNTSILNEKAHQYLRLTYRMVTGGVKYQRPPELDEYVTPTEAREKGVKYAKELVGEARAGVRRGNEGDAAKLILEIVLLVVTPISG